MLCPSSWVAYAIGTGNPEQLEKKWKDLNDHVYYWLAKVKAPMLGLINGDGGEDGNGGLTRIAQARVYVRSKLMELQ